MSFILFLNIRDHRNLHVVLGWQQFTKEILYCLKNALRSPRADLWLLKYVVAHLSIGILSKSGPLLLDSIEKPN